MGHYTSFGGYQANSKEIKATIVSPEEAERLADVKTASESEASAPEAEIRKQQTSEHTLRYNQNKTMYDLIPWQWESVLAEIFTFGAKKYAPHNWKKSLNTTDHSKVVQDRLSSARRHIAAWQQGETNDPESGLAHLGHAAWNLLMILWYDQHEKKPKR